MTLTALTAAYGAFANGGIVRRPILIRKVEDSDGKVLFDDPGKADRAVSEATAFLMASMLQDVINAGTAYRARQNGFMLPAAGKTGTTNDYNDAWFVGFTPKLVTVCGSASTSRRRSSATATQGRSRCRCGAAS